MRFLRYACLALMLLAHPATAQDGPDASLAISAQHADVTPLALSLQLLPLTQSELQNEIAAWQDLLKEKVSAIGHTGIKLDRIAAIEAAEAAGEEPPPALDEANDVDPAEKEELAKQAGELLAERSALLERFEIVLDEYEAKGGDPLEYRLYAKSVSGVKVDFTNLTAAYETVKRWALSEEGGQKMAINAIIFLTVAVGAWFFGKFVSWVVAAFLAVTKLGSKLLRRFIVRWVGRIIFIFGLLYGLSQLGVNITPLVAALGATGFVIGFALQNTLSNFASGLLIMTQRPFDVGDAIEAAGVTGKVDRVTLFSTHVSTFDNSKLTVPNNSIWSSVITNSTASDRKRLNLTFEIKAPFTVDQAEEILLDIVKTHPKVLDEPAPVVRMDEFTDDGFELICWPWVLTGDGPEVRWDIIRAVRKRLRGEVQEEEKGDAAEAA